jgi:hypothetical protein
MGNICKVFNFNKEYYNTNKNTNPNTKPFLDISNNCYFDNEIEPPSYSEIYNIKNREYNNYIIQYDKDYKQKF